MIKKWKMCVVGACMLAGGFASGITQVRAADESESVAPAEIKQAKSAKKSGKKAKETSKMGDEASPTADTPLSDSSESPTEAAGDKKTGQSAAIAPIGDQNVVAGNEKRFSSRDSEDWSPRHYAYSIGYEGNTSGVTGQNAVVFGMWMAWLGCDFSFGFTKNSDNRQVNALEETDTLANSSKKTTTYSGQASPYVFSVGVMPKAKFFHNDWIQVYGGMLAAVNYYTEASYKSGKSEEVVADLSLPSNATVTETDLGNTTVNQDLEYVVGPKVGAEFYLKWFRHLALGFATGVVTTFGGDKTTSSTLNAKCVYPISSGTRGIPTENKTSKTAKTESAGIRGTTFGLGGTQFQFTGIFTIRYIW